MIWTWKSSQIAKSNTHTHRHANRNTRTQSVLAQFKIGSSADWVAGWLAAAAAVLAAWACCVEPLSVGVTAAAAAAAKLLPTLRWLPVCSFSNSLRLDSCYLHLFSLPPLPPPSSHLFESLLSAFPNRPSWTSHLHGVIIASIVHPTVQALVEARGSSRVFLWINGSASSPGALPSSLHTTFASSIRFSAHRS